MIRRNFERMSSGDSLRSILAILVVLVASTSLLAQHTVRRTQADVQAAAQPSVIAGMASSGRHCVSGEAANVHGIGWVAAGTGYTITFESDSTLAAVISRLDLEAKESRGTSGTPDVRATASTSGSMALYVGATAPGGCYRYKVELTPPTGAQVSSSRTRVGSGQGAAKLSKAAGPAAISGLASSAKHCVAGNYVANIHDIGRVEQGSRIAISFESDFDPIAGVTLENLVTGHGTYLVDDDSGGGLQPHLNFTASHSSTLALHVAGFGGSAGCYRYRVDIR